ncbi:MAG: hypothetical protein HWE33_13230 [Rhodobacteraceae bacterium]|nr:hypothetical protein [Paracoccaceae bacterium]
MVSAVFLIFLAAAVIFAALVALDGGPSIKVWGKRLVFNGILTTRGEVALDDVTQVYAALGYRRRWCLYLMAGEKQLAVLSLSSIANSGVDAMRMAAKLRAYLGLSAEEGMTDIAQKMTTKLTHLMLVTFLFVFVLCGGMTIFIFQSLLQR